MIIKLVEDFPVYENQRGLHHPQSSGGSSAIVGVPFTFAFIASALSAFAIFFSKTSSTPKMIPSSFRIEITKRKYVTALLVGTSFGFLSTLCVDFAYVPLVDSIYIGGMELTDGIVLSGLYVPL